MDKDRVMIGVLWRDQVYVVPMYRDVYEVLRDLSPSALACALEGVLGQPSQLPVGGLEDVLIAQP